MLRTATLILIAATLGAADVELALANGRSVRGELVTESDSSITLRSSFPVRGGVKTVESSYPRADILRRKDLPGVMQQYETRKANTPDTVPELCPLMQWSYENCLREQARTHAVRVLELEPDNAWARRILDNCGYIEADGKWVDEAEYMQKNGLARVDGKLVPVAVAEARKALTKAVYARDTAAKRLRETRDAVAGKPGPLAENEQKMKKAQGEADQAKKEMDGIDKKIDEAQKKTATNNKDKEANAKALDELRGKREEAAKKKQDADRDADNARRQLGSDKAGLDKAKAELPALEAAWAKSVEEVKAAVAKLPADDTAAQAALAGNADPGRAEVKPPAPAKDDKPDGKKDGRPDKREGRKDRKE